MTAKLYEHRIWYPDDAVNDRGNKPQVKNGVHQEHFLLAATVELQSRAEPGRGQDVAPYANRAYHRGPQL